MKLCHECKHSEMSLRNNKPVRKCNAIEGKPICINARESWWPDQNRERDCGPDGKLWEKK